jgi:hypothetical protein
LQQWVASQIPICHRELQFRVRCFDPGCAKVLPQTLITHVALEALTTTERQMQTLAQRLEIAGDGWLHWVMRPCPVCARSCSTLLQCNAAASGTCTTSHVACEECWRNHVAEQLERCFSERHLNVACIHPGCPQILEVGDQVLDCICASPDLTLRVTPFFVAAQNKLAGLMSKPIERLKSMERSGIEVMWKAGDCEVYASPFAINLGLGCAHGMCESCWERWLDEQLPSCKVQRNLRLPCWVAQMRQKKTTLLFGMSRSLKT